MNPSASNLDPAELAALLHFYADAGVEWMLEDEPLDRVAEFEQQKAARAQARAPASAGDQRGGSDAASPAHGGNGNGTGNGRSRPAGPTPTFAPSVAVPDGGAVAAAQAAADSAQSLDALKDAVECFSGCNLKNSARSTVFAAGDAASGIMVIGPMPNAEDDRDGSPFSGRAGDLLDRMLAAIGLSRAGVLLTNVIPWRPPGNRMPSQAELDICTPFIARQIQLAQPQRLLLLGNFPARFFIGGSGTIHTMRGEWKTAKLGEMEVPALATFHPQELLAAPANKALAWQDLLAFKSNISKH